MLQFARQQIGKPFSNSAMLRSLFWPRRSTFQNFFCAELVAAILQKGGLIDTISNAGSATPQGLHELFKTRATTTANPYLLRQANVQRQLTMASVVTERCYKPPAPRSASLPVAVRPAPCAFMAAASFPCHMSSSSSHTTSNLRVLNHGIGRVPPPHTLGLTMNSLNFRVR